MVEAVDELRRRLGAATHEATAGGCPVDEAGELVAVLPGEMEEFLGVEVSGFLAQEGFKAPLEIGTVPGLEAVTPSGNPVVAERLQHGCIHCTRRGAGAA